jgi:peptide-methionine (S)-S-oxide reductase
MKISLTTLIFLFLISACSQKDESYLLISSGCFWNVQSFFQESDLVTDTLCAYTGGTSSHPTYENARKDGHVEVVKVSFQKEHYLDVLKYFFEHHPTKRIKAKNEMFGKVFRGRVFYKNIQEKILLEKLRDQYDDNETLTLILPAKEFYLAEDYHQNKFLKRCATK